MTGFHGQTPLKSLTTRSSLAELLRALYGMGLDYCVLPPGKDFEDIAVFTKDQLVSLIELGSSEIPIAEIPKVAQGTFKPFAVFRPDAPPDSFEGPEDLQALTVEKNGASVSLLREALQPRTPGFPSWWDAPVPFAMCDYGRLHVNQTALLMFGSDLTRLSARDIPEKNEFLVTLEGKGSPCTVNFRRLEKDIFMLDDCTGDVAAAADIAWWAAVGKAWAAVLDKEGRAYRQCAKEDAFRGNEAVHLCEWDGDFLGYFCVEKNVEEGEEGEEGKKEGKLAMTKLRALAEKLALLGTFEKNKEMAAAQEERGEEETENETEKTEEEITEEEIDETDKIDKEIEEVIMEEETGEEAENAPEAGEIEGENETLKVLGPQTMGLLTPGTEFFVMEEPESGTDPEKEEDAEDGSLNALGPQTMGILAAGTDFIVPEEPDDEDDAPESSAAGQANPGD
ncbi:MAG: hypothetical protein LBC93_01765 [Synergistaceae bacterium]|jgi:hypothetical protein|nr:hypothetical protein [Synergistaceae bacterium]